jgi:hypothetical protein
MSRSIPAVPVRQAQGRLCGTKLPILVRVLCCGLTVRFVQRFFPTPFRISSHYQPVLLLTSAVLRKDCSKFWPNRYAHFQAAIPQTL